MDLLRGPVVLLAVAGLFALVGLSADSESVRDACMGAAPFLAFIGGALLVVRLVRRG